MSAERWKQLLRSKGARWAMAASLAIKVVLVGVAVFGALTEARAQPLPDVAHVETGSLHPGRR